MSAKKPMTVAKIKAMKAKNEPIAMLTAYDYPSAKLAEQAGVDIILVGDSLGNVVLGYDSTIPVTLNDMIYHTRAVARAVSTAFIVTDLPFMTYHASVEETIRNVQQLMQEGHCNAVKMEGGAEIASHVAATVQAGVPVVGHLGFTPQAIYQIGGYKVQGKDPDQAVKMLEDAKALEAAGATAIVLEMVTEPLAKYISEQLSIPTIGIGAGRYCDGQVLVMHDVIKYAAPYFPKKFVKIYADVATTIQAAMESYVQEVKTKAFPAEEHVFQSEQDVLKHLEHTED